MTTLLLILSSWTITILISIVLLYMFFRNDTNSELECFNQEELNSHNKQVASDNITYFLEMRRKLVAERRQQITKEQQAYLSEFQNTKESNS